MDRRWADDWMLDLEFEELGRVARLDQARLFIDIDIGGARQVTSSRLQPRYPGLRFLSLDARPQPRPAIRAIRSARANALRLPLAAGVADVCYARFMLQYLGAVQAGLAEMTRVTRPGGVVAALEADDDCVVLHPLHDEVRRAVAAHDAALAARGEDRRLGRKLRGLLLDAGLEHVGVRAFTITTEQVEMRSLWLTAMVPRGLDPEVPPWALAPGAFGCVVVFLGWGRVPGG